MKTNVFKVIFLGLASLAVIPMAYAEEWKTIDRYQVKDSLVKDTKTGLMWMRCSLGQTWDGSTCQGEAEKIAWKEVGSTTKNFSYAGYSDWRLPTKEELTSLVYCGNGQKKIYPDYQECTGDFARPTIVQTAFPNTPNNDFWSPSANVVYDSAVPGVDFSKGSNGVEGMTGGNLYSFFSIRLVRSGK